MHTFLMQLYFYYSPGQTNDFTDDIPDDLLDEEGQLIEPLAVWPEQNIPVRAENLVDALAEISGRESRRGDDIFVNTKISIPRFQELWEAKAVVSHWVGRKVEPTRSTASAVR